MPVLRHDEFRLQRHGAVVTGRHHGGGQHGVEILNLVLATLAVRAMRAVNVPGAMILGAVQRDQHVPVQTAHCVQAAGLLKFGHDVSEHRIEMGRLDGIEHRADLVIARDFIDAEQRLTVRAALTGLKIPLMRQE
jgi:hypothetical protein